MADAGMPTARILVIHYTQTGQLTRIVESIVAPLSGTANVTWHRIEPRPAYPFPWKFLAFLDAFPESVYLDPPQVAPADFDPDAHYDLVILAYQVWFLAPSLPMTGFLRSPQARVLKGRKVVSVIACRNMWTMAYRTMRKELAALGAHLCDNVVLTDRGPLWSTFITTPWWLLTGNQGPLCGLLPRAGVSEEDVARTARFGRALAQAMPAIRQGASGPFLRGLGAASVNPLTMLAERIGHRSFRIWGRGLRALGGPGNMIRRPVLLLYAVFLIGAILFVLPISMTLAAIAARVSSKVAEEVKELEGPSGSSVERMVDGRAP